MREATLIQIVGGQQVIGSDSNFENLIRFYKGLYDRLKKDVKNTGDLTRYIGYQSIINEEDRLCFLGIEVDSIEDIPKGMVAWDLNKNTWTVWEAKNGQDVITSQTDISWQWIDRSPSGSRRCTGEFAVQNLVGSIARKGPQCRSFLVSANAYVGLQENDTSNDEIYLVDYDPSWPQQFNEIESWLRDCLGSEIALRVEHYGSTAIEGMSAKPIIDVLVEVPSFSEAKQRAVPLLNSETWEYWWYSDHMIFIKREKLMGQRTHHIHMAPQGHKLWEGLAFRDYLRTHDNDALRYATLKQELATSYRQDRERYTDAKTIFIKEITSKALRYS